MHLAQADDDVRRARDEVTTLKLIRFQPQNTDMPHGGGAGSHSAPNSHGLGPSHHSPQPSHRQPSALEKLHMDISKNQQFLARLRQSGDSPPQYQRQQQDQQQHRRSPPSTGRENSSSKQPAYDTASYHQDHQGSTTFVL
jgi:hypothetical protein